MGLFGCLLLDIVVNVVCGEGFGVFIFWWVIIFDVRLL